MRTHFGLLTRLAALATGFVVGHGASADTVISTFDDFNLTQLFAWSDATIISGPTSYEVTDTGYGSGYKDIKPNIDATGETTIQLTVTVSAPGAGPKDPASGPIVTLVDGDGTTVNYAWYGQTIGSHVLKALLSSGSVAASGSIAGLDLSTLDFFHLQDDPGAYHGRYTVSFEDLRLTGAAGPAVTSQSFDPDTDEFTLTWDSRPGAVYSVLHTGDLSTGFVPLATDIDSGGTSTTVTVTVPDADDGFLTIQAQ